MNLWFGFKIFSENWSGNGKHAATNAQIKQFSRIGLKPTQQNRTLANN